MNEMTSLSGMSGAGRRIPPPPRPGSFVGRAARWVSVLAVALITTGCASTAEERNLAPLGSIHSSAGGGREFEGLGGMLLQRRAPVTDRVVETAVKPFFSHRRAENGDTATRILPPLGRFFDRERREGQERFWQFLPLFHYRSLTPPGGEAEWSFMSLPGFYFARQADGTRNYAWFPFLGRVEHFASMDRADFVLWPLYSRVDRYGRSTHHVLFPIFAWSTGTGGPSWRVWPLVGRNHWEGRYDRYYFLWPFFQYQKGALSLQREKQSRAYWLFPLIGHKVRGEQRSTSVLWPFFGYASNPKTGFWAWDGPWPLVRFANPGAETGPTRQRVWPFYAHFEGDGLTQTYYGWPLVSHRREVDRVLERDTRLILPFWRSYDRLHAHEGRSSFRKFWPLYHRSHTETGSRLSVLSLNPLWMTPILEDNYGWIWQLYTKDREGELLRERGWLGLYRREKDGDEDRRAVSGLWAQRDYSVRGERVRETSWLFGLLRYRSGPEGFEFLAPRLPGPGWPLERVPSSLYTDVEGEG